MELPPLDASAEVWSNALLAPFDGELRGAASVRVLPLGPIAEVDVHALPWDGKALIEHVPVHFSADLPATDRPPPTSRVALVVADGRSDLPHAREEGRRVAARLGPPWELILLEQDAAQRAPVTSSLARADLLHFAGHGIFAGVAGWASRLELADGSQLDVGDVFALPSIPRWVVLSGCETAASTPEARGGDSSLAQAFVASGATAVVAATRQVPDVLGRQLAAALYHDVDAADWDLASAAARALADLARSSADQDWSAYRIITP